MNIVIEYCLYLVSCILVIFRLVGETPLRQGSAGQAGLGHGYFSAKKFLDPGSAPVAPEFTPNLIRGLSSPSTISTHQVESMNFVHVFYLVGETGLEPAQDCSHSHLKAACIPISPLAQFFNFGLPSAAPQERSLVGSEGFEPPTSSV